jgi:hypothetical protein
LSCEHWRRRRDHSQRGLTCGGDNGGGWHRRFRFSGRLYRRHHFHHCQFLLRPRWTFNRGTPEVQLGTMAARRGAPPFFRDLAGPLSTPSTTEEVAPKPPRLFGRVAAVDRRPDIRRRTWSPAAMGASSSEH